MAGFMPEALTQSTISPRREVAEIAALPSTHAAFKWLQSHEREWLQQQIAVVKVPSAPFEEGARAEWLRNHLSALGLHDVRVDAVGNVLGIHPGADPSSERVALSAHIDTVFPSGTQITPREEGSRILAPGIADNGAGLAALLAIAATLQATKRAHRADILFILTVGEEGEGNLRGMRHIFDRRNPDDLRIGYTINVDGAGSQTVVAHALGSKRYEISMHGPGGHSWSDFGTPNAIVLLARFISKFSESNSEVAAPLKSERQKVETSFNFGIIKGGTSVNSIPECAAVTLDIRSTSEAEIKRMESNLTLSLNDPAYRSMPVEEPSTGAKGGAGRVAGLASCNSYSPVHYEVRCIGERPAGELSPGSRILQVIRAVDSQLGIRSQMHRASTDANIPIALGLEAISIGGGGKAGGAHTLGEWFDPTHREVALKRILLAALTLAGDGTASEPK